VPKKKKPNTLPGKGFKRTKKQWENSIADHVGKFVDRLTMTDVLNGLVFAAGTYGTYKGICGLAEVSGAIPDWIKWIYGPASPFLYQLIGGSEAAKSLSELDRVILAVIGGYSMVKLAPVVIQTATSAISGAVA
jgi:hypothetical protein